MYLTDKHCLAKSGMRLAFGRNSIMSCYNAYRIDWEHACVGGSSVKAKKRGGGGDLP